MNSLNAARDIAVKYIDATLQELGNKILMVYELKCNVDVVQKTGQIFVAIIRGMDYLYGGTRLPKLVVVLSNASNMPNLWGCLKLPYTWVYSITYSNIHEQELKRILFLPNAEKSNANHENTKDENMKQLGLFVFSYFVFS